MINRYHLIGLRLASILGGIELPRLEREEGQTLVEYALILVFIALAVIAAITFLGGKIGSLFSSIATSL